MDIYHKYSLGGLIVAMIGLGLLFLGLDVVGRILIYFGILIGFIGVIGGVVKFFLGHLGE